MALPRDLVSQLEKLVDERVRRAQMGSAFTNTGMTPQSDGVTVVYQTFIVQEGASSQIAPGGDLDVDGNANIDGTLQVGGPAQFGNTVEVVSGQIFSTGYTPGVQGWQIAGDGSAEFNDLTLRNVPNSALETASAFVSGSASGSFGAVGTSLSQLQVVSVEDQPILGNATEPYTVALAMIDAEVQVKNTTGSTVTVTVAVESCPATVAVGSGQYKEVQASVAAGARASIPISMMRAADPGGSSTSFVSRLLVKSSAALASDINNYAFMFASTNFYRSATPPP